MLANGGKCVLLETLNLINMYGIEICLINIEIVFKGVCDQIAFGFSYQIQDFNIRRKPIFGLI